MSWWPLCWIATPERIEKRWTMCQIYFNQPLLQFMSKRDNHSGTYTPTIISSVVWELALSLFNRKHPPNQSLQFKAVSITCEGWNSLVWFVWGERSICLQRSCCTNETGACCAVGQWVQWRVSPVHILLNPLSPILRLWNLCVWSEDRQHRHRINLMEVCYLSIDQLFTCFPLFWALSSHLCSVHHQHEWWIKPEVHKQLQCDTHHDDFGEIYIYGRLILGWNNPH